MKSILKLMIVFLCIGSTQIANAHSETIANLTFEQSESGLIVTASLEKNHLAYGLKKEAKCLPKDMMNVCATQFFTENITVEINGQKVDLVKTAQRLTLTSLVITYEVKYTEAIKNIVVQSDYMIKYNAHAKLKVISKLETEDQIYSLSARRKKVKISL